MPGVQWRAWVGPRWRDASEDAVDKWLEIASTAVPLAEHATTLSATLNSGATSAALASVTGYSANDFGWAFIGPNGSGQGWEYVDYEAVDGSNLVGLTRESATTREHNGVHTSGATVRMFWPITTDDGTLTLVERLDDAQGVVNWQATISGVRWPQAALRHAHLVAIEWRADAGEAWDMLLLGWVDAPRVRDDERKHADWTVRIVSSFDMVAGEIIDGIRCGEFNIGHYASASSDTPLAQAQQERGSGDFIEADPDTSAASAVDEDDETLWIAERHTAGNPSKQTTLPGGFTTFATIVRLWKYPGEPDGYRYIEFQGVSNDLNRNLCNKDATVDHLVELSAVPDGDGRLAIVEDAAKFASVHPLASNRIIEIGSAIFDLFDLDSDCVAMHTGGLDTFTNVVSWGGAHSAKHENSPDPDVYSETWPGTPLAAPGAGEMLRYWYDSAATERADHFQIDEHDIALYFLTDGEDPWILLEIPGMGLELRDDIADDDPAASEILYIVDAGGNPATGGLPSSGTLQIANEQITYNAKTGKGVTVTARGANGTTAADHVAGDAVLIVDTDGVATSGAPIKTITFKRPGGAVTPSEFKIRRSNLETARVPTDDNHDDDYEVLANVSGNTATTYTINLSPSRRCRYIILEIDHMTVEPHRPRINEMTALLDESFYDAATWLIAPTVGDVIEQALINAGLVSNAIAVGGGMQDLEHVSTARDTAGAVIADLADFGGGLVVVERTSAVAIYNSTFWSAASQTPTATWTRDDVRQVEVVQMVNRRVSQVRLPWRTPDDSESGEERYPAEPTTGGKPLTLDEMVYAGASSAQNAAKRRYLMERYPWRFVMELAQPITTLRPGAIYAIQWQFASDMAAMTRTLRLIEVEHTISRGRWQTTAVGLQIDREATN